MKYYVCLYTEGQEKPVDKKGPMDQETADQVEKNMNINLDHAKYYTRIEV